MSNLSQAVKAAWHRHLALENSDESISEHRIASFAVTLVNEVFLKNTEEYTWVFTPEQTNTETSRKPDYTVEAVEVDISELDLFPWLHMEFKKIGGERTYKALRQLVDTVGPSLNEKHPARYLVVAAGYIFSFWELDYNTYNKRNNGLINHLWGCRSLLQPSIYRGDSDFEPGFDPTTIKDTRPICEDSIGGPQPRNNDWIEAQRYTHNVLFDLRIEEHCNLIVKLMEHIAKRRPAAMVDVEME
jgi:hypothetical protein